MMYGYNLDANLHILLGCKNFLTVYFLPMNFTLISYKKKNTLYNIANICYYALWKKTQNANNSVCVQVQKCITKYYKKKEKK